MQDAPTTHPGRSTVASAPRRRPRPLALAFGAIALASGLIAPASPFAATSPAATDGTPATTCTGGPWPYAVQGMPAVHAGSAAGDYLWHDATGWHLRVTHPGTYGLGFSGTIRAKTE